MTTLQGIIEILKRMGIGKVVSVIFGLLSIVMINIFNSHNALVDVGGTVLLGLMTAVALLIPNKNK